MIQDAIKTSQQEDRIVRIAVNELSDVLPYVEDYADTPDGVDCWGSTEDGGYFRILVTVAE
jgi:hypothetical protein